jgi:hypothetical protein
MRYPGRFVYAKENLNMKVLELPITELKATIAGFHKVVGGRITLPALGCVRVQPSPEGVELQVTDLDSFATCRIKTASVPEFPPCLLSLATLAKVTKASKDVVSLIHQGGERFTVRQDLIDLAMPRHWFRATRGWVMIDVMLAPVSEQRASHLL